MKLSLRTEYALLALMYLSRLEEGDHRSMTEVARHYDIPEPFLQQILYDLRRGGYVESVRGKGGGYRLARHANEITLAEVVRLLDGPLAPTRVVSEFFYQPSPLQKEAALVKLFREIRDFIADRMEKTTLADMVMEAQGDLKVFKEIVSSKG